jgi:hypothetical protein
MVLQTIDTTVVGLQGIPVAGVAPTAGQALTFNGSSWVPGGALNATSANIGGAIIAADASIAASDLFCSGNAGIEGELAVGTPVAGTFPFGIDTSGNVITSGNITIAPSTFVAAQLLLQPPAGQTGQINFQGQIATWSIANEGVNGTFYVYYNNVTQRFAIDDVGNTYNTSGAWSTLSDPRLKSDAASYASGLAEILGLNPITFRYNGQGGYPADPVTVTRIGLDAEETRKIMPEIVGSFNTGTDAGEVLTLSPGLLAYAMINAIKELAARMTALEAK